MPLQILTSGIFYWTLRKELSIFHLGCTTISCIQLYTHDLNFVSRPLLLSWFIQSIADPVSINITSYNNKDDNNSSNDINTDNNNNNDKSSYDTDLTLSYSHTHTGSLQQVVMSLPCVLHVTRAS